MKELGYRLIFATLPIIDESSCAWDGRTTRTMRSIAGYTLPLVLMPNITHAAQPEAVPALSADVRHAFDPLIPWMAS